MTSIIQRHREAAYRAQGGRCFYCRCPMWQNQAERDQLVRANHLTSNQARRLRCTAEHLVAKRDGGPNGRDNIVAACWLCNQRRHRRKNPLTWQEFLRLVTFRVTRNRWHFFGIGAVYRVNTRRGLPEGCTVPVRTTNAAQTRQQRNAISPPAEPRRSWRRRSSSWASWPRTRALPRLHQRPWPPSACEE